MIKINWGDSSLKGVGVILILLDDLSDVFNKNVTLYNNIKLISYLFKGPTILAKLKICCV